MMAILSWLLWVFIELRTACARTNDGRQALSVVALVEVQELQKLTLVLHERRGRGGRAGMHEPSGLRKAC